MADDAGDIGALLAHVLLKPVNGGMDGGDIQRGVEPAMVIDHQAVLVVAHADIVDILDLADQRGLGHQQSGHGGPRRLVAIGPAEMADGERFDMGVNLGRIAELGYSLVLFTDVASVVHRAVANFYSRLLLAEQFADLQESITPFSEFNEFLDLSTWREREARHTGQSR